MKIRRIAPELHAQLPSRKKRDHRQHHARKKTENGDRLQYVEQRNHEALGARVIRGYVAVDQREYETQTYAIVMRNNE